MADYLNFDEGRREILANGLPATSWFLLSTKPCSGVGAHKPSDKLANVGEVTGTGYKRLSEPTPEPSSSDPTVVSYTAQVWATLDATDWPAEVHSVVLCTSGNGAGRAISAWNLVRGGDARDMSQPNTAEMFTPTLVLG